MTVSATVRLGDVATVERDMIAPENIRTGTLYVGLEHVESSGQFVGVREVAAGDLASTKFSFDSTHVLYGKLRPYLCKIARPDFAGVCTTEIVPIKPGPRLNRDYLFHFLRQPRMVEFATSRCSGANLPRLSPKTLIEFEIPLPPLAEQKRIAAVLDKADDLRGKRRQALATLDTLLQSVFFDMFGDPVTNPKGWPIGPLGEIIESVTYGTGSPPEYIEAGIPFVRATNIKAGTVVHEGLKHISTEESERLSKCRVRAWDMIVVRSGVYAGVSGLIPPEFDGACAAFDLLVRMPRWAAVFYNHWINSPAGRAVIEPVTRRAGQPHINSEQVQGLRVIRPPRELVDRFVGVVDWAMTQRTAGAAALEKLDTLLAALQSAAFAGTLFNGTRAKPTTTGRPRVTP